MGASSDSKPPLAPGMVLGPDGKPCKACTAGSEFRAWRPPTKTAAVGAAAVTAAATSRCPPDKEALGAATWTFLHTAAALPALYPCSHCADDFGESMKAHPPDVSSRAGLSRWFCERHNEVNAKLGKDAFDCSLDKTDERWRTGPADGSCD
ncbi:Sulfhydryl oxidase [Mycena kentingensis (nom. inval.)]|nr:Sulfhydryl oxidase [Mycena kentingensis (nom. inval.)]